MCVYDNVCVLVLGERSRIPKSIIKLSIGLYLLPSVHTHTCTHTHTAGASHTPIRRSSSSPQFPLSRSPSAYLERRLHRGDRGEEKEEKAKCGFHKETTCMHSQSLAFSVP